MTTPLADPSIQPRPSTGDRVGTPEPPPDPTVTASAAPPFSATRLLFLGTGSLGVMFMPMWASWIRAQYPDLEVRAAVTRSAQRFVTRDVLTLMTGREVMLDVWRDEPEVDAQHVELAAWPDAVLVHPASYHFVSRFACGLADSPVSLALQCTSAPIALAPALPPGGVQSAGYARHLEALAGRGNVVVLPPQPGYSVTTGRRDGAVAVAVPTALAALERLRLQLQAVPPLSVTGSLLCP